MENKIINEEILRISEIMGVEKKPIILEGIGDDIAEAILRKFGKTLTKGTGKTVRQQISDVFSRMTRQTFDELFNRELKQVRDQIVELKTKYYMSDDEIIDELKNPEFYGELFDSSGTFEKHVRDFLESSLKSGIKSADDVVKLQSWITDPVIKENPKYYEKLLKDNWDSLRYFFVEGTQRSEKDLLDFVGKRFSGPTTSFLKRFLNNNPKITKVLKTTGKIGLYLATIDFIVRLGVCYTNKFVGEGSIDVSSKEIGKCVWGSISSTIVDAYNLTFGVLVDMIAGAFEKPKEQPKENVDLESWKKLWMDTFEQSWDDLKDIKVENNILTFTFDNVKYQTTLVNGQLTDPIEVK